MSKPIFDPEELSLLTPDEMILQQDYVKKLRGYCNGSVEGTHIKNLNAGMANVTKLTQSRSAMAVLKYNMLNKGDQLLINDMTGSKKK